MRFRRSFAISVVFFINFISTTVTAGRLRLRPLTGEEVYRILKDAGREDAIPEGRIVTQGIAAVSGFALGLKSGIAVPLAIGLATSNATQQFLNNINYTAITSNLPTIPPVTLPTLTLPTITLPTFNVSAITSNIPTINMTALTNLFKPGSSNSAGVQYTTQEICFNSRSLNEISDEDDGYDDDDGDGDYDDVVAEGRQAISTISEPMTADATATGEVTTSDDGDGTGTQTMTTTQTGNGGTVNCVVIQKPAIG